MNALWAYAEMAPRGFEPPTNGIDRGDPIHSAVDALYARLTCLATASNDGERRRRERARASETEKPEAKPEPRRGGRGFRGVRQDQDPRARPRRAGRDGSRAVRNGLRNGREDVREGGGKLTRGLARGSTPPTTTLAWRRVRAGAACAAARRRHRSNGASHERPRRGDRPVGVRRVARAASFEGWTAGERLGTRRRCKSAAGLADFPIGGGPGGDVRRVGRGARADAAEDSPSCWRHRVEELREELGLRSVPAEASAAADDDDVVVVFKIYLRIIPSYYADNTAACRSFAPDF